MSQPFKCYSCGGPLKFDIGDITVRCEFCGNSVIVPEELRESVSPQPVDVPFLQQIANLKEIGRLIRAGKITDAIKLYRQTFGVGLQEAKTAVEKLSGGNPVEVSSTFGAGNQWGGQAHPAQLKVPQSGRTVSLKGCSPFALALLIIVPLLCVGSGIAFFAFTGVRESVTRSVSKDKRTTPGNDKTAPGFARVVMTFGSEGIGAGQFKDVRTVAVDGVGHIYAADYTGGRVQVFDSNGKFLTQWMVDTKFPLLKLAVDRRGVVYIVQRGSIDRYNGMTGESLGKIQPDGKSIDDVIVTLDGGLVAVQNNEDLVRIDGNGRVVSTIAKSVSGQSGDSELDAKVAVDGEGNLYSMGRFNDAIFKYSLNGKFITRIGGEGDEPGLFRALNSIAVDGQGRIFVGDIKGIQVFTTAGRFVDVIKVEKSVPFGMVFNDNNELFVAGRTQIIEFAINK